MICYFRSMSERLEAHFQNRIYYFYMLEKKPDAFTINMYNFPYTFVNKNGRWENHQGNKMEMSRGLVVAVAIAAGEAVI